MIIIDIIKTKDKFMTITDVDSDKIEDIIKFNKLLKTENKIFKIYIHNNNSLMRGYHIKSSEQLSPKR